MPSWSPCERGLLLCLSACRGWCCRWLHTLSGVGAVAEFSALGLCPCVAHVGCSQWFSGCSDEVLTLQEEFSIELAGLEERLELGRKMYLHKLAPGSSIAEETEVPSHSKPRDADRACPCLWSCTHCSSQLLRKSMEEMDSKRRALHAWAESLLQFSKAHGQA